MKQKCKKCGKNADSEYCFKHKPKKRIKSKKLTMEKLKAVIQDAFFMQEFFRQIWNEREHKSEISGERLFEPISSIYFHHILPKDKYQESALDRDNIILLSGDEHSMIESDVYKYEEINKRREYLKTKYNIV